MPVLSLSNYIASLEKQPLKTCLDTNNDRYLPTGTNHIKRDLNCARFTTLPLLDDAGELNLLGQGRVRKGCQAAANERLKQIWLKMLLPKNEYNQLYRKVFLPPSRTHMPNQFAQSRFTDLRSSDVNIVFILSKGRHNYHYIDTYANIQGVVPVLVVKPAEFEDYLCSFGQYFVIMALPTNEGHIGYAREWTLQFARKSCLLYCVTSDDNVQGFRRMDRTADCEYSTPVLPMLQDMRGQLETAKSKVATLSLPIAAYDRHRVKEIFRQRWACSFVMLNVKLLREPQFRYIGYDVRLRMFEDILFSHRCNAAGLLVVGYYEYRQMKVFLKVGGCSDVRH